MTHLDCVILLFLLISHCDIITKENIEIMEIYFNVLILILGILTTYSDSACRRIRNLHILVISLVAILSYGIFYYLGELNASASLIINPLTALTIGFILYFLGLWKAGDAKLFFTYSLLLPTNTFTSIIPLSSIVLFINTFLISFLAMLPSCIIFIIHNSKKIINEIINVKTLIYFAKIFSITFLISWIIKPVIEFSPFKNSIFSISILLYFAYLGINKVIYKVKRKALKLFIFIIGFILRYIFIPESITFLNMGSFFRKITIFSLIIYILNKIITLEEKQKQRIPFAPSIFLGAILSNTNFLIWAIKIITFIR